MRREQPVSTPPTAAQGENPWRREARDACLIQWRREVLIHHATANPDPPTPPLYMFHPHSCTFFLYLTIFALQGSLRSHLPSDPPPTPPASLRACVLPSTLPFLIPTQLLILSFSSLSRDSPPALIPPSLQRPSFYFSPFASTPSYSRFLPLTYATSLCSSLCSLF